MSCVSFDVESGKYVAIDNSGNISKLYENIIAKGHSIEDSLDLYAITNMSMFANSEREPSYEELISYAKSIPQGQLIDFNNKYKGNPRYIGTASEIPILESAKKEFPALAPYIYSSVVNEQGSRYVKLNTNFPSNNFFQTVNENEEKANKELNSKVGNFLSLLGVKVETLEQSKYKDKNVNAVADMLAKIAYVSTNKATISTLPEEASHFLVEFLKQQGNPLYNSMLSDIDKYEEYQQVLNEYGSLPEYEGNTTKLKEEAIGKVIANRVVTGFKNDTYKEKRITTWFDKVLDFFNSIIKQAGFTSDKIVEDYFQLAANTILNSSVSQEVNSSNNVFNQNTPIKQGVDFIFEQNPELATIGTEQQYSQYLNTIFPDSKIKDIVYYGSIYANKQKFKESTRVSGNYFAVNPNEALQHAQRQLQNKEDAVLYSILLDIKNPLIITKPIDYEDLDTEVKMYRGDTVFGTDYDAIIAEKVEEYNATKSAETVWLEKQIVIFEPSQAHILGSKKDIEGFKKFTSNNNNVFFQTTNNKAKDIITLLDARDKEIRTIEKDGNSIKEILKDGVWKKITRVSEVIKGFFNNENKDKNPTEFGTKVHSDIEYYAKQAVGQDVSNMSLNFSSGVVTREIKRFVGEVLTEFPLDKFEHKFEVNIHNNKVAGTIDWLIINKDTNEAHLIDYKNVTNLKYKGINNAKKKEWQQQLDEYTKILKDYGIKKIGMNRMIPIHIDYNQKLGAKGFDLTTFNIARLNNSGEINVVPSFGERYKTTKPIDNLLAKMEDRYNRLIKTGRSLDARKLKDEYENLQITKDLEYIKVQSTVDKDEIERTIQKYQANEELTDEEVYNLVTLKDYYKDRIMEQLVGNTNEDKDVISELADVTVFVQRNSALIDEIVIDSNSKKGFENTVNKPFSSFDKLFNLSQRDNPAFQSFYRLMRGVEGKKEQIVKNAEIRVKALIEKLKIESGKSDESMYYDLYQKGKDGKPIPKLISARNNEWFTFFKEHSRSLFNNKELTLDTVKKSILGKYIDFKSFEELFNKEMKKTAVLYQNASEEKQFEESLRTKNFLLNRIQPYSDFIDIENANFDKYLTSEYKNLLKKNSVLLDLYKEMVNLNKYANKYCDAGIKNTALPYVRKGMMQNFINNPLKTVNTIRDSFNINSWETFDIDSKGEKIYKIPLKYNTEIKNRDLSVQSYDLGELLLSWTDAVYTNDLLNKSHDTSLLFREQLKNSKQYIDATKEKDKQKGIYARKDDDTLYEIPVDVQTIEEFNDYHNAYFYGLQDKSGDFEIPLLGKNGKKVVKSTIQYFSAVNVGFNIFSALSNITGGGVNAYSYTGKHYKKLDLAESSLQLGSKNSKMLALSHIFDLDTNIYDKNRYKDLSVSKLNSIFTLDKIYALQKGGDWFMSNSIMGAMTKSYTVKDKKIVLKEEGDVSLFDMLEEKNDKYVLPELEDGEIFNFREKSKSVIAGIIGNSSEFDRALANNTFLGQIALQYRRWMLPLGVSRFGNLKYNSSLEEFQIGKYRTFTQLVFSDFKSKKLKDLITFVYHGKGGTIEAYVLKKYNQQLEINPKIGSFEDFKKLYRNGLISTVLESVLVLSLIGLKMGLDDDDDKSAVEKSITRMLGRTIKESTFWIIPSNFEDVISKPFPIIQGLSSVIDMFALPIKNTFDEDKTLFEGLEKKATRNIIGLSAYYKFIDEINKD